MNIVTVSSAHRRVSAFGCSSRRSLRRKGRPFSFPYRPTGKQSISDYSHWSQKNGKTHHSGYDETSCSAFCSHTLCCCQLNEPASVECRHSSVKENKCFGWPPTDTERSPHHGVQRHEERKPKSIRNVQSWPHSGRAGRHILHVLVQCTDRGELLQTQRIRVLN